MIKIIKTIIIIFSLCFTFYANAETVEEIIKGRKALFSKNYSSAKRVQALSSKGECDKAKSACLYQAQYCAGSRSTARRNRGEISLYSRTANGATCQRPDVSGRRQFTGAADMGRANPAATRSRR